MDGPVEPFTLRGHLLEVLRQQSELIREIPEDDTDELTLDLPLTEKDKELLTLLNDGKSIGVLESDGKLKLRPPFTRLQLETILKYFVYGKSGTGTKFSRSYRPSSAEIKTSENKMMKSMLTQFKKDFVLDLPSQKPLGHGMGRTLREKTPAPQRFLRRYWVPAGRFPGYWETEEEENETLLATEPAKKELQRQKHSRGFRINSQPNRGKAATRSKSKYGTTRPGEPSRTRKINHRLSLLTSRTESASTANRSR